MLKHFVVTRLGLAVYSQAWFDKMIGLFEAVTLSSLARQSSQHFVWLIAVSADMPPQARERIERLLRPYSNYHLIPIDLARLLHMRHGSFDWIWNVCQDYILDRELLDDPYEYVVTSLIDADDAWDRDVVSIINNFMHERLPEICADEDKRGTAIRHTSGMAVTFEHGHRWFIAADAVEPMHYPFLSMGVFVAARFSSGISACSSRHGAWHKFSEVLAFEAASIEGNRPMWVYARHDATIQPWDARNATPMADPDRERLSGSFGIDFEKVRRWNAAYPSLPVHKGASVTIQFDRMFRIAGLNRQIESLKRRGLGQTHPGSKEGVDNMIAQCESRRATLIEALRASRPSSDIKTG
jgi:hypothetical protein